MELITQTLNINNLRTTRENSIKLYYLRKLVEYHLRNITSKVMLILAVLGYCGLKIGRYCELPSGAHGAKGLKFHLKAKRKLEIS